MAKHILFLTLFISWCIQAASAALTRLELTQNNFKTHISSPDKFFIIQEKIDLPDGEICVVDQNSVLCFDGGSFSGGRLDLNGAAIQAPDYCIFNGTRLEQRNGDRCVFGNREVSALWFMPIGLDKDVAPVVNHALETAPACLVTLGGYTYKVKTPIVMDIKGQSLRHAGTIEVVGDITAFSLRSSSLTLQLHHVRSESTPTDISQYVGTGIELSQNVTDSDIKVDKITGMKYGIYFEPYPDCPMENDKIDFMEITATYGIYFNLNKTSTVKSESRSADAAGISAAGCRNHLIFGGVINSKYGIYFNSNLSSASSKDVSGLLFSNITFGTCKTEPIRLRGVKNSQFPYMKFSDEAKACSSWIDLEACNNLVFGVIDPLPYNRVSARSKTSNIVFEGLITGSMIDSSHYINRMFITPEKENSSTPTKFLTSDVTLYNMINTLDYPGSSGQSQTTTITVSDLLVNADKLARSSADATNSEGTKGSGNAIRKVLSGVCVVNIGSGRHVVLDLTQNAHIPDIPLTVVVNLDGQGNSFGCKTSKTGSNSQYGAGTYRISWDKDEMPQIIRID